MLHVTINDNIMIILREHGLYKFIHYLFRINHLFNMVNKTVLADLPVLYK